MKNKNLKHLLAFINSSLKGNFNKITIEKTATGEIVVGTELKFDIVPEVEEAELPTVVEEKNDSALFS